MPSDVARPTASVVRRVGRYALFNEIAAGGMATVYFGRLIGAAGFTRTVAIKRLHEQFARDPDFVAQFLDEAHLAARIHHPNVVQTLDVVATGGELFLVMEYVEGESLVRLLRGIGALPLPIGVSILGQVLQGLHAAHEARGEDGSLLHIVHRDVSPQNVLVGIDGTARVLDFGVAKAASRLHTTGAGQIKGKLAYMSPEQLRDGELDRRSDIFACGVVAWECLSGKRLFARSDPGAIVAAILAGEVPSLRQLRPELPASLAQVVEKALHAHPDERYATALAMAEDLEAALTPASMLRVGAWVRESAAAALAARDGVLRQIEDSSAVQRVGAGQVQKVMADSSSSPLPARFFDALPPDQGAQSETVGAHGSASADAETAALAKRRPRRLRAALVLLGVTALIAVAYGLFATESGPSPSASSRASPASSAAQAVVVHELALPIRTERPPESAPVTPSSALAPSVPSSSSRAKMKRAPVAQSAATDARCNPPFALDASGRKRFKPECFR